MKRFCFKSYKLINVPNRVSFFSTIKQKEKTMKKVESEQVLMNIGKMETVAEQEQSEEKIMIFLEERRKEIVSVAQEKDIPKNALITATIVSLPVILGGPLLNLFCFQNMYMDSLLNLVTCYIKYSGVHLNFMVKTDYIKV